MTQTQPDKVIGILGGMGPEATMDIYARITEKTKIAVNEDHLRIIIDSNPKIPSRQDAILHGTENPGPYMADAAKNLEKAGADLLIIGANTAHYFYEAVDQAVQIPVLHMINETVQRIVKTMSKVKTVGVLATKGAIQTRIFHQAFEKAGIHVIHIPAAVQEAMQQSIFSFKTAGKNAESLQQMEHAINYYHEHDADVLVMGCTEIALILGEKGYQLPMINPNDIMAEIAVEYAKNKR